MNRVQSLLTGGTQAGSSDQGSESDQETSGQSSTLNRGGRPQRVQTALKKVLPGVQGVLPAHNVSGRTPNP